MASRQINDLMKAALHAHYDPSGTLQLGDLLALFAVDFPDYFGMGQKQFLMDQLTSLGVPYASTLHLDDLAQLYWANVTFGAPATSFLLISGTDHLLISGTDKLKIS